MSDLTVDGVLRVRNAAATRYRGDDYMFDSGGVRKRVINAFDDTGSVFLPTQIDTLSLVINTGAAVNKPLSVDSNGHVSITGNLVIGGNLGAWQGVTFGTGWRNKQDDSGGGGYDNAEPVNWRRVGDTIEFRGVCYRYSGSGITMFSIPYGAPPARLKHMLCYAGGVGVITLDELGGMKLVSGDASYVSLENIWIPAVLV